MVNGTRRRDDNREVNDCFTEDGLKCLVKVDVFMEWKVQQVFLVVIGYL